MSASPLRSVPSSDGWPLLRSPFAGVDDAAWTAFCGVLSTDADGKPRALDFLGPSGAIGMFAIPARRLADLNIGPAAIQRLRRDPRAQRNALMESLRRYFTMPTPADMTHSGALAIRHCAGPNGVAMWQARPLKPTTDLFRRANGLF